jgi:hypothetical protein
MKKEVNMKEYKFKTEFKLEACIHCPCLQYRKEPINEKIYNFPKCGVNEMPLDDTEEKSFHCPLIEVK